MELVDLPPYIFGAAIDLAPYIFGAAAVEWCVFSWHRRAKRRQTPQVATHVAPPAVKVVVAPQPKVQVVEIPIDPPIVELERLYKITKKTRIATRTIMPDGSFHNCEARRIGKGNWYSLAEGDTKKITWEKRRKRVEVVQLRLAQKGIVK